MTTFTAEYMAQRCAHKLKALLAENNCETICSYDAEKNDADIITVTVPATATMIGVDFVYRTRKTYSVRKVDADIAKRMKLMAEKLCEMNRPVIFYPMLPFGKGTGVDSYLCKDGDIILRAARAYDIQRDEFIIRIDCLIDYARDDD